MKNLNIQSDSDPFRADPVLVPFQGKFVLICTESNLKKKAKLFGKLLRNVLAFNKNKINEEYSFTIYSYLT